MVARSRAIERACAATLTNASAECERARRASEHWGEATRTRVRALSGNQSAFHAQVERLRRNLERDLSRARKSKTNGADMAKSAVKKCLTACETLRAEALPRLRELSEGASAEDAQLSRKFLHSWEVIEKEFRETFNALVDFDQEIAQRATLVDPTSLLALVEDASTCAGARTPELVEAIDAFAMECVVPKRLHLLPKAREGARASEVATPLKTIVATSPAPAGSTTPYATPYTPGRTNEAYGGATPSPTKGKPQAPSREQINRIREDTARELKGFLSGALAARDVDEAELAWLVDEFLALDRAD